MKVLVINCGSSSFKYQLLDMPQGTPLCSGLVERIGDAKGRLAHKIRPGTPDEQKITREERFADHKAGMLAVAGLLTDKQIGVIASASEIFAVGHRVVQGGETLKKSCRVGQVEKEAIRTMSPLAPLHNPANLQGIEVAQELFANAPSVAVFDTEFHSALPPKAYMYPVPYEFYTELKIRRYGFHGTSHSYVSKRAAEFLGKPLAQTRLVTCHLGNGCSMSAVRGGVCVDTSMGMTPLDGLMMGTRSGAIDPAIHAYLAEHQKLSVKEIDEILNKKSGLKGICGMNDMRDIHAARESGDSKAQLAFEMFCHGIKRHLGMYLAVLGGADALVFTAGIGENDEFVRAEVCSGLEDLGIALDAGLNDRRSGEARCISRPNTKIPVLVIPTNEELEIAQATLAVLE